MKAYKLMQRINKIIEITIKGPNKEKPLILTYLVKYPKLILERNNYVDTNFLLLGTIYNNIWYSSLPNTVNMPTGLNTGFRRLSSH